MILPNCVKSCPLAAMIGLVAALCAASPTSGMDPPRQADRRDRVKARLAGLHAQIREHRARGHYQAAEPLCKEAVDLARRLYPSGGFRLDDNELLLSWVQSAQWFPERIQKALGHADELKYLYRRHHSLGEY
ncbi:MAG: hypothetical protein AAF581_15565, partial [Planctomycetota bacterium]